MIDAIDKTRGALANVPHRFEKRQHEAVDDGWGSLEQLYEDARPLETLVSEANSRSIISRNQSPDIPFSQSINPYQGCEHGCVYCFARPTHAYLDLNPGLDFETRLTAKTNAAELLRKALQKPGYQPQTIALGVNTDAYQPIEHRLRISRQILEVLVEFRHPVAIITKSRLLGRDLDLLRDLARDDLVDAMVSLTSLDPVLKRTLEPRAAGPQARLQLIRQLAEAGIPVGTLIAPVIPAINDSELEKLLAAAHAAGARRAAWILLRLPHEVAPLFRAWLQEHHPQRAAHVMSLIQQSRGGKDYESGFGTRMRGRGPFAELLAQRFKIACTRLGLNTGGRGRRGLNTAAFQVPGAQLPLI